MKLRRTSSGVLVVAMLAALGYALVSLPPRFIEGYHRAAELSPNWGYAYLATVSVGALLLSGITVGILARIWGNTRRKRARHARRETDPSRLSRQEIERELADNLEAGGQLAQVSDVSKELRGEIHESVAVLNAKRESQTLEIVAFGTISSGKSSLLNALAGRDVFRTEVTGGTTLARNEIPWPGADRVILADTPGLAEVGGEVRAQAAAESAKDADLVLFVVDGPLKSYEIDLLRVLGKMEKRTLVCLNKQDWYRETELPELCEQISKQVAPLVEPDDIVTVLACPAPRRRVRVMPDGQEVEETIDAEPEISRLADRMMRIVKRDGRDLLLANLLLQSRGLVDEAQSRVLSSLDNRAHDIINRTMWAAGGAVAVNPFPLLDLAGGSALTVKMVLDLARVYGQEIDADTVVSLMAQLGKNLVAMLGVTAASPAIASALATTLKTVPGIGTITGGLIQGLVQALVTLWIGKVFVAYFRSEMKAPAGGFAELARQAWQEVTRPDQLRKLIQSGRKQLFDSPDGPEQ